MPAREDGEAVEDIRKVGQVEEELHRVLSLPQGFRAKLVRTLSI